jgi:hypothetical protein
MSPCAHTPALTGSGLGASLAHCLCSAPNIRQLGGYLLGVPHYFAATLKGTLCYGGVLGCWRQITASGFITAHASFALPNCVYGSIALAARELTGVRLGASAPGGHELPVNLLPLGWRFTVN